MVHQFIPKIRTNIIIHCDSSTRRCPKHMPALFLTLNFAFNLIIGMFLTVVVVKWSACSLYTRTIGDLIPLKYTIFIP